MPKFRIVLESQALGCFDAPDPVFANFADDALTDYLAGMEPHGVKRLSGTTARFLDEVTVTARPVEAVVVPMYASAGAMAAPGRERWRR